MPNLCINYLKVGPTTEAARSFLERLAGGGFGAFVPEPPAADIEWRIENWGEKWDIDDEQSEFDLGAGKASFVTAWKPPTEWFRRAARMFPALTLELHHEECGERLFGWMKSEAGILTFASEEPVPDAMDEEDLHPWVAKAAEWYDEA